jgi:tellurium resistance protein TerD
MNFGLRSDEVSLSKGDEVSLSKRSRNLKNVTVGLGWHTRQTTGDDFDLDASAIGVGANGKVPNKDYFVFFNNLKSPDGAIEHTGDDLVGSDGEDDDETINVDLQALAPNIGRIIFPVSIYDADARRQNFGQVRRAYIRIVDKDTGRELARYNLTEEASNDSAMIFGELIRNGRDWNFKAVGIPYASGLLGIAQDHGVNARND